MTTRALRPEEERLKVFLRERRQRLDPNLRSLGDSPRLPNRCGRPVTQEEIAEAVGISRAWYAMLESGATNRTSPKVLDRIATALMLDPKERALLFQLVIPAFGLVELRTDAKQVLEGFSVVRAATKRLWTASSETEALQKVGEEIAAIVDDADLVFYTRRVGEGRWEWPYVLDRGLGDRNREAFDAVTGGMTPAEIDEFLFFPGVSGPGDIGTPGHFTSKAVRSAYLTFCDPKLDLGSLVHVRVRTRRGLIAGFTVKHRGEHEYPEEQRAILATLAELTSVALS